MQRFLATPKHWPSIVLSSHSVEPVGNCDVNRPLQLGEKVDEIFGLPPILPLKVQWKCVVNDESTGDIVFESANGLRNVAKSCRMTFKCSDASEPGDSKVEFQMEFDPITPLAYLATPLLSLDNDLAVKILLPFSVKNC